MKAPNDQKGFSYVEIFVFIIIIVIVMAIAVPRLLESYNKAQEAKIESPRKFAFEAAGLNNLRAVIRANSAYKAMNGRYGNVRTLAAAGLLDATFSGESSERGGYVISGSVTPSGEGFCVTALPVAEKPSRAFGADEKGLVYTSLEDGSNSPSCSNGVLAANGALIIQ